MIEFELWEGMQWNMLRLLEAKFTLDPRQKATVNGKDWTHVMDLQIFPIGQMN